jgi:Na+/melibiose symporter-like transporter
MKINNVLFVMICLRIFSGLTELGAACLMYYFKNVNTAIKINAIPGLVGPLVLILVSSLGLIELSSKINTKNLFLIAVGVFLILIGSRN